MQLNNTFRLFVSSTFADFHQERELLQAEVFPEIRAWCRRRGFSFQPIDLRWGVTEEAQLDQKTLELCLNEVRVCKSHPHPNFLIMLGDRYGWVPLPWAIESTEFETLLARLDDAGRQTLEQWYQQDLNQLPPSYILKERSGDYVDADNWARKENELRELLQDAVNRSHLPEPARAKYFRSATEAEIDEGILPVDQEHIFGFLRDGATGETSANDPQAQALKQRVKDALPADNIYQVQVNGADDNYLQDFKARVIEFLKSRIDTQAVQTRSFTALEIEQQAQDWFAQQKRTGFMGQTTALGEIRDYIDGDETRALLIHGPSGMGKSALMAKAIEQAQAAGHKTLYRFVGATPEAQDTRAIWISLFDELGVDLRSEQEKAAAEAGEEPQLKAGEQESFQDFSDRLFGEIQRLDQPVVIFIDALDQLTNPDPFLWLPQALPAGVKLVLSALDDLRYPEESQAYQTLTHRPTRRCELPPFDQADKLLEAGLKQANRSLQPHQWAYFNQCYAQVRTPLYITIALQELKHWKSFDPADGQGGDHRGHNQTLETSQPGIVAEFIGNLSDFYHHPKELVQRVLGYLHASRDGLSESEILQLLSADSDFVRRMENQYHQNRSGGLPVVYWARLATHLYPFLATRRQQGETLRDFFHREFGAVIGAMQDQQHWHRKAIEASQSIIEQVRDDGFDANRWGRLYIALITEYALRHGDAEAQKQHAAFIAALSNKDWVTDCLQQLNNEGLVHHEHNRTRHATAFFEIFWQVAETLYAENPSRWAEVYTTALNNLALSYGNSNRVPEAIALQEKTLEILEALYAENPSRWAEDYTNALGILMGSYANSNRLLDVEPLAARAVEILKTMEQQTGQRHPQMDMFTQLLAAIRADLAE